MSRVKLWILPDRGQFTVTLVPADGTVAQIDGSTIVGTTVCHRIYGAAISTGNIKDLLVMFTVFGPAFDDLQAL